MSLRVWLPLTNDLSNQGLSGYSIGMFRGTETYNNDGKLGKCFYANGVNTIKIYNILPDFYNYTGYSLSAWFYIEAQNTSHSGSAIISAGNWNGQVLNLAVSDWSNGHYAWLRVSGTNWAKYYPYTFELNTWYHVVVCSDGNKTYAYVNGELIGDTVAGFLPTSIEGSDIAIGGATYSSIMQFFGRINDVRIYDQCLSAKEVKEISKGLVAHYTFGDKGQANLAKNSLVNGNPNSSYNIKNFDLSEELTAGEKFTVTLKGTLGADKWFGLWMGGGYTFCGYFTQVSNSIFRLTFTSPTTVSGNGKRNAINIYAGPSSNTNLSSLTWLKIEKGEKATSWLPNVNDTEYTTMGYNDTTVYDSSGYNYHGTVTEALTSSNDSPRYDASTHFNGTAYSYVTSISSEIKSISLWVKWDSIPSGQSVVFMDYKSRIGFGLMSTGILCGSVANTYKTFSKDNLVANTWYHFVIVNPGAATGTDRKLYINGVEQTAKTTVSVWSYSLNYLQIGKRSTTSDGFVGCISDFRMYSTVLSDDDVLELYHTGESISKDKTLLAYSYNEPANGELMNVRYTIPYTTHYESSPWTSFNEKGEATLTANNQSLGSVYVPVNPTGKTYYYDMQLSINAGNQFYVGFERYDADKTPRRNNACVYVYSTRPTTDVVKQRFRGTVDLSTDGVNPCAFVTLRVLNGWSGTTSGVTGKATIH